MGKSYYAVTVLSCRGTHFGYLIVADKTPTLNQLVEARAAIPTDDRFEVAKIGHELSRFLEASGHFRWLKLTRK